MRIGMEKLEAELAVKHRRQIDLIKQEHIREGQKLIKDVEKAQASLKQALEEKDVQYVFLCFIDIQVLIFFPYSQTQRSMGPL